MCISLFDYITFGWHYDNDYLIFVVAVSSFSTVYLTVYSYLFLTYFVSNLLLGDIMQLQFVKSTLTVNPCMVSERITKHFSFYFQMKFCCILVEHSFSKKLLLFTSHEQHIISNKITTQVNIWKILYLNFGEWYQDMIYHHRYLQSLSSCEIKAWKLQAWREFEPMTSAIP